MPGTECTECCCRRFDAAACRAELKEVLRAAGVEGTPLLLFLEERHLADDPGEQQHMFCAMQRPVLCWQHAHGMQASAELKWNDILLLCYKMM
jgi:hypothetical protein